MSDDNMPTQQSFFEDDTFVEEPSSVEYPQGGDTTKQPLREADSAPSSVEPTSGDTHQSIPKTLVQVHFNAGKLRNIKGENARKAFEILGSFLRSSDGRILCTLIALIGSAYCVEASPSNSFIQFVWGGISVVFFLVLLALALKLSKTIRIEFFDNNKK
ncbi:hypothetical protein [Porphyromonas levii]|uniref:hypothetical protein n=1 Tax=Porphyromonas levii TaxID=28114 RepID=UPI000367E45F|nr:hypothetical protein [Porphyromonas levii]